MTFLTSWSIRKKLIGLGVASAAAALVLAAVPIIAEDQFSVRATKLETLTALATIVGHSAATSLSYDDDAAGTEILSGLRATASVRRASLSRRDGTRFATYTRGDVTEPLAPAATQPDRAWFGFGHQRLHQEIALDGETVGSIFLESDLSALRARLVRFMIIMVLIVMAAASVSLLLSSRLQRLISAPLLELGAVAQRVSRTKDYTLRATSHTTDEIGQLIGTFNEMLATVESRDQEVERHRLQLQDELRVRAAVNIELAAAKVKAEESNAAKSQFLANMSHEIRTPMNGVMGMTELLMDTPLDPSQREYLDVIKLSAHALLGVIEDILDFSKIEAGMLDIDPIPVEVSQVFGDAIRATAPRAHEKGLALGYHASPAVPAWIVADPLRLRQVLTNLLGNAVKFTDRGKVSLDVDAEALEGGELTLHIRVTDTGIGIPAAQLEQIFAPFEQADGSATRKHGGTGLGLTISGRLAKLMRGRIWVESEEGRGSTFHFTARVRPGSNLPSAATPHTVPGIASTTLPATPPLASPTLEGEPPSDTPLRILLAEDNAVNQTVAVSILSRLGHEVTVALNGRAAIDAYRRQTFDVILMDVQMPVLSGYDATRAIRQIEQTTGTHIAIVAMTARVMKGDRELCLEAGMDDYVSKPIQGKQIMEAVLRALSRRPGIPAAPDPAIDEAIALALVGGDRELLRQAKDLCVIETPKLLDEIERALIAAQPDALSAASHGLRGMYLVFGPNDIVTIAGHLEELAMARDLTAAAVAFQALRPAAERLRIALGSHDDAVVPHRPGCALTRDRDV